MNNKNAESQEIKEAIKKRAIEKSNKQAINTFSRTMIHSIEQLISKATFDKTYQGRITQNLGNGSYKILIYNQEYNVKSETGRATIPTGSTVKVVAPQNNFSEIFIY